MKFDFSKITSEQLDKLKALCVEFNLIPNTTPTTPTPVAVAPVTAPVKKFGEATLKDGTVIKWDGEEAMAVGTPLLVIDPANPTAFLPHPDGDIELVDGTKVTVKDGKVESLTPVVAEVAPATPDMSAQVAQMSAQLKELAEKFDAVSKEKEAIEIELKSNKTEVDSVKKTLEDTTSKLKDTLEMFSKVMAEPVAEPTEPVKNKPLSGIGSKVKQ